MIKLLEKNIADKIAAGEVIERPISIVKELVENSIDAGASEITVEIRNGGKTFVRVTDNGCGIPRSEAETAFLRHATSKIATLADLTAINSLGFRGEALASIAAVTRTSLITRPPEERTGCRITIHGGEVIENTGVGCPEGTTMIVTDLFYNTPARRQFLKSDSAESGLIIDFVSEMAMAYHDRRFQLINNGRNLFSTPGDGNLKKTIAAVYHRREYEELVEVEYGENGYSVSGCISRPSLTRSTRRDQVFFVNGRIVKSRIMERGVSKGYRERLAEGRQPVVFLFLRTDPETVDVNIHPNKKEVRFHDEKAVISALKAAVFRTLAAKDAVVEVRDYFPAAGAGSTEEAKSSAPGTPDAPGSDRPEPFHISAGQDGLLRKERKEDQIDIKHILSRMREEDQETSSASPTAATHASAADPAASSTAFSEDRTAGSGAYPPAAGGSSGVMDAAAMTDGKPSAERDPSAMDLRGPRQKPFDFSGLKITGSIFDTYITAEDSDGFYLIDQHAAQERIFYERLAEEYLNDDKPSQTILTPITLEVPLSVREEEYDWIDSLRDMGYHIEEFGPSSYIIREIPYFMEISEAESFLHDFVDQIGEQDDLRNTVVIDKLITRSCKSAVKARDHMSDMELRQLIRDLARCRNPFSCPHGRPTFIRFSMYDIEKMFKRA